MAPSKCLCPLLLMNQTTDVGAYIKFKLKYFSYVFIVGKLVENCENIRENSSIYIDANIDANNKKKNCLHIIKIYSM